MSTTGSNHWAELTEASARVRALREHALERGLDPGSMDDPERELAAARSWLRTGNEASHLLRRGILAGDILRAMTPIIDPGELLVGKWSCRSLTAEEQKELEQWRHFGVLATDKAYGQRDHLAIDYPRLLRLGVSGIRAQIAAQRERLDLSRSADLEKDFFYRGCLAALEGMTALAGKYAAHAEEQAATCTDPTRQAELLEIARICRKVPEYPAESFAEAMQSIHFATLCLRAGNQMNLLQFGRPDRYLLPYYRRDLAAGRITPAVAQELIDCLSILLNETTARGLAVGWMVGGRDESGMDVSNALSALFVQTIGHVRLAYPGVGICWNPDTPPELMALAARLLARGCSHPALFNDEVITKGLLRLGLPYRDACQYVHSTCVEITPVAESNVYVASPYYNLMQCLHDLLGIPPLGGEPGPLPEFDSFEALLDGYRHHLGKQIRAGVTDVNTAMMSRAQAGGFPLLSCFVNDCLARGLDIDQGGARVNWIESSFVGLANLVDALAAIRQLVFEESSLNLAQLREALLANFKGYEQVQALLTRVPKYGNDEDRVDALAQDLTSYIAAECRRFRSYWGDAVVPGLFCWIQHEALGRQTGASADGRVAGFPFADGSGPAQGREQQGPTAMIHSVTKWDHSQMIGGIAVNLRFTPGRNPNDLAAPLGQVLEGFLRLGGFEAQVNVVDTATLRAAQQCPEQHRDLVVRVAGYSDYFVRLSPEMQAEILMRSELSLG